MCTYNMFSWRNKKNINIFGWKSAFSGNMAGYLGLCYSRHKSPFPQFSLFYLLSHILQVDVFTFGVILTWLYLIIEADNMFFFLFLHKNMLWVCFFHICTKTCCGYSLEAPRKGFSNKYPPHVFVQKLKKMSFLSEAMFYVF